MTGIAHLAALVPPGPTGPTGPTGGVVVNGAGSGTTVLAAAGLTVAILGLLLTWVLWWLGRRTSVKVSIGRIESMDIAGFNDGPYLYITFTNRSNHGIKVTHFDVFQFRRQDGYRGIWLHSLPREEAFPLSMGDHDSTSRHVRIADLTSKFDLARRLRVKAFLSDGTSAKSNWIKVNDSPDPK